MNQPAATVSVPVTILGKEYIVACPESQRAALVESAQLLDRQMRDIRDRGKVLGVDRIAVMAALNLAHQLIDLRERASEQESLSVRLRNLNKRIDTVLQKSAQLEL